jgi:hypothetical protein
MLLSLALIFPLAAFGELDDNTLTVTSSRTLSLQPDQVGISVTASFEATATLDDVLSAVQSAGITVANLSNAGTYNQQINFGVFRQTNQWYFVLQVPFPKLSSELTALTALEQSIATNPTRSLTFYVQGTQVSSQLSATGVCPYAALFQEASTQAHTLASVAGVMLGPVVAVSDGSSVYPALGAAVVPTAAFLTGDFIPVVRNTQFSAVVVGFGSIPSVLAAPQTCTLSVQFRLLH